MVRRDWWEEEASRYRRLRDPSPGLPTAGGWTVRGQIFPDFLMRHDISDKSQYGNLNFFKSFFQLD